MRDQFNQPVNSDQIDIPRCWCQLLLRYKGIVFLTSDG